MSIFFRFISELYLKSFFIIFLSLLGFFVGVDLLLNFKDLSDSVNLVLLYVVFLAFSAVPYVLPISLVFALILSLISMIRSNEFVSLYALGLSKNLVILYPFLWALFFCFVYVILNCTPFAYANDYQRNIIKNGVINKPSGEAFLKFNDSFIYIQNLQSGQNIANNIKIFNIKDLNLSEYLNAKTAVFNDNSWILKEGNITLLPNDFVIGKQGLKSGEFKDLKSLEGFKPKIIEGATSNTNYSILDALASFEIFRAQGVNTNSLKTSIYKMIFTPFFAPFLMLIIYYFFPVISRFFNLAFIAFVFFIITLLLWGMFFLFTRLSENGVILGEVGIVMPVMLLMFFSLFMFYKHR